MVLKAWCAEQDGEDVQAALQECLEQGVDCAFPYEDLLLICLRGGYDPSPFLEPLYLEDWVACFHKLVSKTPLEGLPELLALGEQGLQPVDAQQFFFLAKLICQRMMEEPRASSRSIMGKSDGICRVYHGIQRESLPGRNHAAWPVEPSASGSDLCFLSARRGGSMGREGLETSL